ncbi:guanosine nucleotide diphosphate dissociationinhibitor 1 [Striga asiatica]|uniref:Guanosine nucleotide diphosphate dissociationinhibitor 1 n=1 Tax=Striga asiatica TaxID=4170 RepID=A0A5A7QEL5_STRAF|nr:guanosine nucleotide diphosphate dissociationinhibitor 1 [Striga asiatica]
MYPCLYVLLLVIIVLKKFRTSINFWISAASRQSPNPHSSCSVQRLLSLICFLELIDEFQFCCSDFNDSAKLGKIKMQLMVLERLSASSWRLERHDEIVGKELVREIDYTIVPSIVVDEAAVGRAEVEAAAADARGTRWFCHQMSSFFLLRRRESYL